MDDIHKSKLTKEEIAARADAQAAALPSRMPKKPKLVTKDKAASRHWARILKDMEDLEIIDVLDTDALAIYCAKLSRRDRLQEEYLQLMTKEDLDLNVIRSSVKLSEALSQFRRQQHAALQRAGQPGFRSLCFRQRRRAGIYQFLPQGFGACQLQHGDHR